MIEFLLFTCRLAGAACMLGLAAVAVAGAGWIVLAIARNAPRRWWR